MSEFVSSSEAFRLARERASVAAAFEATLLHQAIYDAKGAGLSVREAAVALGVPKSTVDRHWREGYRCPDVWPLWGSEEAWRDAHAVIWSHDPRMLADDWIPFEWKAEADRLTLSRRTRGIDRRWGSGSAEGDPPQRSVVDRCLRARRGCH